MECSKNFVTWLLISVNLNTIVNMKLSYKCYGLVNNLIFFIDSLVVIVYGRLEFPIIIIQNITVMGNIAPVHIMEVRILRAHFHKCKISKFTWINKCIVNILLYLQLDKGFLAKIAVPSVHCVHFCG